MRSLSILERQTKPGPFKDVLGDVVEDVSAGTPMSEAMAKHERVFDRLYSSMVRAGEAGGVLDHILERLAQYRERMSEIRSKIVGAMIYPLVIVIVAVIVVSAVIVWVIPRFVKIFESFDVELPQPTLILLNVSGFTVRYWYVVFGVPVLLLVLHGILMRRRGRYRFMMHKLLLKLPLLGGVLSRSLIAAFSRTFGTLLQAGVPHLDALGIVRDTSSNEVLLEGVYGSFSLVNRFWHQAASIILRAAGFASPSRIALKAQGGSLANICGWLAMRIICRLCARVRLYR
jgi:type IV pilus assembly protein PilC